MHSHKDSIVSGLTKGIEGLFAKNKVTYIKGHATIAGPNQIAVSESKNKREAIQAKHILIATGSSPASIPSIAIDHDQIINSDDAIALTKVPDHLVIIGAGVIGLELGSVWRRLGAKVTVIEYMDKILPQMDNEVSTTFQKILEKQGIEFKLSTKLLKVKTGTKIADLVVEYLPDQSEARIKADKILLAIGRKPNTEGLGANEISLEQDERGRLVVNDRFQTNIPSIYAIGDVIAGPMLAHKAEEDGVAAVEIMAGQAGHVDYNLVPSVVYTDPEIASIGKTEEQLKEQNIAYNKGKFPFMANSRARANDHTDGFVKILADKQSDEVLGVHIIGKQAGTIIGEASVAMAYKASSEDLARICHSHPDLNEAVKEAALATFSKPIHL